MSFEYGPFNYDQPHQPTMAEVEKFFEDTTDEYKVVPRPELVQEITGEGEFDLPAEYEGGAA
jgi:hypothetical protein